MAEWDSIPRLQESRDRLEQAVRELAQELESYQARAVSADDPRRRDQISGSHIIGHSGRP